VRAGRSYVSDGFSHLMNYSVNGFEAGTAASELRLDQPSMVKVTVDAACLLPETSSGPPRAGRQQPRWHPEYARAGSSRDVTVEVVVNGQPVASQRLTADGSLRPLSFDVSIAKSSWVALRILGSAHTNPVFVLVGGRPIRASRKSAEWCVAGVDQCWKQKSPGIRPAERPDAQRAYDVARERYQQIVRESEAD
jgi:hypothetical protein